MYNKIIYIANDMNTLRLLDRPRIAGTGAKIMWRAVISSWAIAAFLLLVLAAASYAPNALSDGASQARLAQKTAATR